MAVGQLATAAARAMAASPVVWAIWATLAALVLACEIAGRVMATRPASQIRVLPLATVLVRVRSNPIGRAVLVLAWAWLGWHAFAR